MLLDTGDGTTTLFGSFAAGVRRGALPAGIDGEVALGISATPVPYYMSLVQPLTIGGIKIERPVIRIVDDPPQWVLTDHFDGILGRDVYKLFRMTIDYANNVIYLEH